MAKIEITSIPGGASVKFEGPRNVLFKMLTEATLQFLRLSMPPEMKDTVPQTVLDRLAIEAYTSELKKTAADPGEAVVVDLDTIKRAMQGGTKND